MPREPLPALYDLISAPGNSYALFDILNRWFWATGSGGVARMPTTCFPNGIRAAATSCWWIFLVSSLPLLFVIDFTIAFPRIPVWGIC